MTPTTAQALPVLATPLFYTLILLVGIVVIALVALALQNKFTFREAARRAARTFVQAVVASVAALFLGSSFATGEPLTGDALLKVAVSALIAGCIALISLLQNLLEDNTDAMPTIAKVPGT